MAEPHYTVTVYVAAPGTPLLVSKGTSAAGHLYYVTSDGQNSYSYGFAPIEHGASSGPGKRFPDDNKDYQNPLYARTMEISADQYNKLNRFGEKPDKFGFDMKYDGVNNSCIDYTWAALNQAGIHSSNAKGKENVTFEGAIKPASNVSDIKSIHAPYPNSELNKEVNNPMPKRTMLQWLVTENEAPNINQLSPAYQAHFDNCEAKTRELYASNGFDYDKQNGETCTLGVAKLAADKNIMPIEFIGSNDGTISIGNRAANGVPNYASAPSPQIMSTSREEAVTSTLAAVAPAQTVAVVELTQNLNQNKGRSIG